MNTPYWSIWGNAAREEVLQIKWWHNNKEDIPGPVKQIICEWFGMAWEDCKDEVKISLITKEGM